MRSPNGSPLLVFHIVGVYIYSAMAYYMFYRAYRKYANLRVAVMLRHSPENYTVVIRELPSFNEQGEPFSGTE